MLDLEKLARKIDLALSKETEESLTAWLLSIRNKELFSHNKPLNIKGLSWAGLSNETFNNSRPLTTLSDPNIIFGNEEIRGPLRFNTMLDNIPRNWCKVDTNNIDTAKNMTPDFSGSFFLYKIAS